jgi:hypothetical protein
MWTLFSPYMKLVNRESGRKIHVFWFTEGRGAESFLLCIYRPLIILDKKEHAFRSVDMALAHHHGLNVWRVVEIRSTLFGRVIKGDDLPYPGLTEPLLYPLEKGRDGVRSGH